MQPRQQQQQQASCKDGAAASEQPAAAGVPLLTLSSPLSSAPTHALQQLDLSAAGPSSSGSISHGSPVSMPWPSNGAGPASPAMAGPSLPPLTPGVPAERPPAPSAASPLLLRRPAAAIASTPAPGRAAGRPNSAAHEPPASGASEEAARPEDGRTPPSPPSPPSPALLEARAGVQEANAVLRQAQAQRRQLWDLADRLLAAERGGRWEAEQALGQARRQVKPTVRCCCWMRQSTMPRVGAEHGAPG